MPALECVKRDTSMECSGEVTGVKADRTGCQCPVVSCWVRVIPVTSIRVGECRAGYCGKCVTRFSDTVICSSVGCLHVSVLSRRSSAGLGVCQEGHQNGVACVLCLGHVVSRGRVAPRRCLCRVKFRQVKPA